MKRVVIPSCPTPHQRTRWLKPRQTAVLARLYSPGENVQAERAIVLHRVRMPGGLGLNSLMRLYGRAPVSTQAARFSSRRRPMSEQAGGGQASKRSNTDEKFHVQPLRTPIIGFLCYEGLYCYPLRGRISVRILLPVSQTGTTVDVIEISV